MSYGPLEILGPRHVPTVPIQLSATGQTDGQRDSFLVARPHCMQCMQHGKNHIHDCEMCEICSYYYCREHITGVHFYRKFYSTVTFN